MKLNLSRIHSISITLEAIEDLDRLIEHYDDNKPGPVYMTVRLAHDSVDLQVPRPQFCKFARAQKSRLIAHLEERFPEFEYDPDADWGGDDL